MITGQRILDELGRKAWSGFNADDMVWDSEDSQTAKAELNSALRYIINLADFPFKQKTKSLMLINGIEDYTLPSGQVQCVYNADTLTELTYIGDTSRLDKKEKGEPTGYSIGFGSKPVIKFYPIPDKMYNINVVFFAYSPVKAADGTLKTEFENADDVLNIPDNFATGNIEIFFMDCLVLKTMEQNNKDDQDENYKPIINEFNERWKTFKKIANPVKVTPRIVGI
jgi:hypothetical protein